MTMKEQVQNAARQCVSLHVLTATVAASPESWTGRGDAFRLTADDRTAIRGRVSMMIRHENICGELAADPGTRVALARIGARAIGCREQDLRDVELAWVWLTVIELLDAVA
jgi:hypothetical protein